MTNNKLTATVHNVKILPEYFAPIAAGLKRAELRLNDRNYHVGDTLNLNEWDIESQSFTGQFESVRIINVDDVGMLAAGYVLLSFERDVDAELQERRKAESEAQATLKRLAVIMYGSEVDINLLTVMAQSLVDRCKAVEVDKQREWPNPKDGETRFHINLEDPEKRLARILKENVGRYHIDEDGVISTNWEHPEVQKEMRRQLEALKNFRTDEGYQ